MPLIPFSVSARTAQLIGHQNFASSEGAVIELVKNSYDADAKNAIVLFDNTDPDTKKHCIFIIDNGIGMDDKIIQANWMMIGTDNKEDDYETDDGRVKTGAKGIGRFALDKLGEIAELYTQPKGKGEGCYWKVNWNDFKQKGISISQVNATLEPLADFNYKTKIAELTPSLIEYTNQLDFSCGTLIKISSLKESWAKEEIDKLFENLEILIPPKEQPVFKIALFSTESPTEYGDLRGAFYDDYDCKITATFLDDKDKKIKIEIQRNELDLNRIIKDYMDVFSMPLMKNEPFDFESFKKEKIEYSITLSELLKLKEEDQHLLEKIGKFNFTFYFLKITKSDEKSESDTKKYPYRDFNSATRRAWLKKFGGVRIFRDEFRVRPYGESGQDWLKLGERQAQSPQGAGQRIGQYRIRPNQISGTINISRITNVSFQDKSGREGIQENEIFDLFQSIIKEIISQFEKDRNVIMYSFSERFKKINAEEEKKRKAEEEAKRVLEEQQKIEEQRKREGQQGRTEDQPPENQFENSQSFPKAPTETEVTLALGLQAKDDEIELKESEIRLLRSLSGIGLIVASFAHELRSIRSLLVARTEDLKLIMEKLIDKKKLKNLPSEENPFDLLNHMREQDVQVKHWLDYSLSALRKDKRTRTNLDVKQYFESFEESWVNALGRRKVKLTITDNLKSALQIRAFPIDFDTVFNNLLINSLDSFKRRKDSRARKVDVSYESDGNVIQIFFADNGAGLSKDYYKSPEEIFLPFETSKVDKRGNKIGTGIGMYLAKTIIEDYQGAISILEINDGFKLGITIPLRQKSP